MTNETETPAGAVPPYYWGNQHHHHRQALREYWGRIGQLAGVVLGLAAAPLVAKLVGLSLPLAIMSGIGIGWLAGTLFPLGLVVTALGSVAALVVAPGLSLSRAISTIDGLFAAAQPLAAGIVFYLAFRFATGLARARERMDSLVQEPACSTPGLALDGDIDPWAVSGNHATLRGSRVSMYDTQDLQAWYGRKWQRESGQGDGAYETYAKGVIRVGGYPMTWKELYEHVMLVAGTGGGKTQSLLWTVHDALRAGVGGGDGVNPGVRMIVIDNGGEFMRRFWKPGDLILNPLDARSVAWQPLNEVRTRADWSRIARSIIPDGKGHEAEWHRYAQNYFTDAAVALGPDATTQNLIQVCTVTQRERLIGLFAPTRTAILTHEGNEKMFSNVRTTFAAYMNGWDYLPPEGDFSIRDWTQRKHGNDVLWLPFTASQQDLVRPLIRMWMDMAVNAALEREDGSDPLVILIDELDTLGKLPSLKEATTKLRKKNVAIITAFQAISQLQETYGDKEATTLMSCLSTKVVLRQGDAATAEAMSRELGDAQIERSVTSRNEGSNWSAGREGGGSSSGSSTSVHREIQRAVMASELTALNLAGGYIPGFIRRSGSDLIYRINVPFYPDPATPAAVVSVPAEGLEIAKYAPNNQEQEMNSTHDQTGRDLASEIVLEGPAPDSVLLGEYVVESEPIAEEPAPTPGASLELAEAR